MAQRSTPSLPVPPPPRSRRAIPRLERVHGSLPYSFIAVMKPTFNIGRGRGNDLQLLDLSVSRQHARLRFANGVWYIQDLSSRNGIRVNNIPIRAARLNRGDRIILGRYEFVFSTG